MKIQKIRLTSGKVIIIDHIEDKIGQNGEKFTMAYKKYSNNIKCYKVVDHDYYGAIFAEIKN